MFSLPHLSVVVNTVQFLLVSFDFGFAIYARYAGDELQLGSSSEFLAIDQAETAGAVSYVAHLAGAIAGLTIGLLVLKSFEQKLHEQLLWWIALGTYLALVVFAIAFNIMNGFAMFNIRVEKIRVTETIFNDFQVWNPRRISDRDDQNSILVSYLIDILLTFCSLRYIEVFIVFGRRLSFAFIVLLTLYL